MRYLPLLPSYAILRKVNIHPLSKPMPYSKLPHSSRLSPLRFRALDQAREAVIRLRTLKPFLSPQDQETLALLMDKEFMVHLEKSLKEEEEGRIEPLESILK